jgi:glycosyltransferase involved in cell wall biosynthesis
MKIVELGMGVRPIPPDGYGAIEQTIWDLTTAFRALGHEVEVVNPVEEANLRHEWRPARRAPRMVRGHHGDVLHIHLERQGFFLGLYGIPYVLDAHVANWTYARGDRSRRYNRFHNRLMFYPEVFGARWAAGVVAETEVQRLGILRRGRPRGELRLVDTGVDTTTFSPNGQGGDPHVVLGIGVVQPRKRWHLAARALEGTGMELRIVGPTAPARGGVPAYAEKVRASGRVELLGEVPRDQLVDELHRCGMVVHPSSGETVGLAVLQGLAAGRPVIASSAITVVGESEGALVHRPPVPTGAAEEASLVQFIREEALRLCNDGAERARLGQVGREAMLRRFSWESVARGHLALFQSVLDARDGRPMLP